METSKISRKEIRQKSSLKYRLFRNISLFIIIIIGFILGAITSFVVISNTNIKGYSFLSNLKHNSNSNVNTIFDPFSGKDANILIIGSDSRNGENNKYSHDKPGGARSDSQLLVHLSADRSHVEVISIPRDTWVAIPSCKIGNNKHTIATQGKFNSAFAYGSDIDGAGGGASCTAQLIEKISNVRVDGFVVVDFSSFSKIINSLGGVDVCIHKDIDSPKANLKIKKGLHKLNGTDALSYARARTGKGLAEGSDLSRLNRQHELMSAIMNKVISLNFITNLPKLIRFSSNVTKPLTVSSNLDSIKALSGLAYSIISHTPQGNISFFTIPVKDKGDKSNVLLTKNAYKIFSLIKNDKLIPGTKAYKKQYPLTSTDKKSKNKKDLTGSKKTPNAQSEITFNEESKKCVVN